MTLTASRAPLPPAPASLVLDAKSIIDDDDEPPQQQQLQQQQPQPPQQQAKVSSFLLG